MNIHVHRYDVPTKREDGVSYPSDTWQGWIEDDERTWIAFIGADGRPLVWLNRDADGGVIGNPSSTVAE